MGPRGLALTLLFALAACDGEPTPAAAPAAAGSGGAAVPKSPRAEPVPAPHDVPAADAASPLDGDCTGPDAEWNGTIRVSVVSQKDGLPVPEACVRVVPGGEAAGPPREVVTAIDGHADAPVWTGDMRLVVTKRGFLPGEAEAGTADEEAESVVVELIPGDALDGRVVLAGTGEAVAGARVVTWGSDFDELGIAFDPQDVAVRPDGTFEIPGVASDELVHLAAFAPGFGPVEAASAPGTRGTPLVFELGRGGVVSGTVRRGEPPAPVAGARVWLVPPGRERPPFDEEFVTPDDRHAVAMTPSAVTDTEGRWRISGLAVSAYVPFARLGRGDEAASGEGKPVDVTDAAERTGADVLLRSPTSLSVRVVRPDGASAADREVSVTLDAEWTEASDACKALFDDTDGAWHFRVVAPGAHHVFVEPSEGAVAAWEPVTVADGAANQIVVTLRRGLSLRGTVRDESGGPIGGATVYFFASPAPGAPHQIVDATSGPDGAFVLEGLPAAEGESYAHAKGYLMPETSRVDVRNAPVAFVLRRGARIVGRLPASALGRTLHSGVRQRSVGHTSEGEADEQSIEFDGLASGEPTDVFVARPSGAAFVRVGIVLGPGETLDIGEIVFSEGVAVLGVVRGPDGEPLRAATVRSADWWASGRKATTDAEGGFRLANLPPVPTWFWVSADGFPRTLLRWTPGEKPSFDIGLARGGTLTGRCVVAGGSAVPEGHVDAERADLSGARETWEIRVDPLGGFREALPAGRYRVFFHGRKGASPSPLQVTVTEGAETAVEITVGL